MNKPGRAPRYAHQRGATTLMMVLILLLVVTLIGLASLRGTLMEEHMSSSVRDRGLAFQAAEAAVPGSQDKPAG